MTPFIGKTPFFLYSQRHEQYDGYQTHEHIFYHNTGMQIPGQRVMDNSPGDVRCGRNTPDNKLQMYISPRRPERQGASD